MPSADPKLQVAVPPESGTASPPWQGMACPDESETTKVTVPVGGWAHTVWPETEAVMASDPPDEEAGVKSSHVCEAAAETGWSWWRRRQ